MVREYPLFQVILKMTNFVHIDPTETIHAVECSFDETYILIGKGEVKSIDHSLKSRMSYEESDTRKNFSFLNIFYQRIKNHCKIFNSFVFIKTFILVAHGNIVSLFSVLGQKWIRHIRLNH
jgi:hypothetical protein